VITRSGRPSSPTCDSAGPTTQRIERPGLPPLLREGAGALVALDAFDSSSGVRQERGRLPDPGVEIPDRTTRHRTQGGDCVGSDPIAHCRIDLLEHAGRESGPVAGDDPDGTARRLPPQVCDHARLVQSALQPARVVPRLGLASRYDHMPATFTVELERDSLGPAGQ